jgi:hypothetical protein
MAAVVPAAMEMAAGVIMSARTPDRGTAGKVPPASMAMLIQEIRELTTTHPIRQAESEPTMNAPADQLARCPS